MMVDDRRAVTACGLATMDCEYDVGHAPAADEKVRARGVELRPGGPAARAALTARRLGAASTLLTCLGESPVDAWITTRLQAGGVDLRAVGRPHSPVVASVVLARDGGTRAVVSAIDRAPALTADVDARVTAAVNGAGCVLLDGHYPEVAYRAAVAARASGVPVLADAGSWREELTPLLARADVVVAGEPFARDVGGVDAAVGLVRGLGVRWIAVTRGPAPIVWAGPDGTGEIPLEPVVARNTNGAGDVFHGAAAVVLARRGAPAADTAFVEVLERAAWVAGVAVGADDPLGALDAGVAARFDAHLGRGRP
jgi:sugar/nucleoside kinase (ribokinase family)